MTPEELADLCFRRSLTEVGADKAFQFLATHGKNPYAWLANPPLASPQTYAGCESLAVPRNGLEREEDAQLDTSLESRHSNTQDSRSLNSEAKENEAPAPLLSTGIYAFLFRPSSFTPSTNAEHNAKNNAPSDSEGRS